jgi:hypothetical protein
MAASSSPEQRQRLKKEYPELESLIAPHWNGGRICGQCAYFSQLGAEGSGLNGMCTRIPADRYLSPIESCFYHKPK